MSPRHPVLFVSHGAPDVLLKPGASVALVNAPASQVFMALVSNTPYSMLVSPEVSGNVTVRLKNV
ncbi:hypothetical protein, partial [Zoogloea sp.]|uniref:hypothetical protein n=1 Tax=Zoogloea sp. TaxID=49181 RepID=UPI001AC804D2